MKTNPILRYAPIFLIFLSTPCLTKGLTSQHLPLDDATVNSLPSSKDLDLEIKYQDIVLPTLRGSTTQKLAARKLASAPTPAPILQDALFKSLESFIAPTQASRAKFQQAT